MAVAALLSGACGGARSPGPSALEATAPDWPELRRGALMDYVPAAGLRWLLVGSPRYFAQHPELGSLRDSWLTQARFRAFTAATGIDLTRTEQALVAGFALGTLYMADASGWVEVPEVPFTERLAGSGRLQRPHPLIWRVVGLVGSVPQALVRTDREWVAVAVGDPSLARVAELRARGKLGKMKAALEAAALSDLPPEFISAGPLRFYALGPFEGQGSRGGGLLAGASALGATLELDAESVHLHLVLTGYWDPESGRGQLLDNWQVLAASRVGRLLGLSPREPIEVEASPSQLRLKARLDTRSLVAGIQTLGAQDIAEVLRLEPIERGVGLAH